MKTFAQHLTESEDMHALIAQQKKRGFRPVTFEGSPTAIAHSHMQEHPGDLVAKRKQIAHSEHHVEVHEHIPSRNEVHVSHYFRTGDHTTMVNKTWKMRGHTKKYGELFK